MTWIKIILFRILVIKYNIMGPIEKYLEKLESKRTLKEDSYYYISKSSSIFG
tara:strand:- start:1435 stop:1590 length:156 start_codon:yes stop_codon:yes gene_type:complete